MQLGSRWRPGFQRLSLASHLYATTTEPNVLLVSEPGSIDLRSVGWGNIFQLPFKHVRDFRLRHLVPFFIYSGFEVLFACTGLALVSTACVGLPEKIEDVWLNLDFR